MRKLLLALGIAAMACNPTAREQAPVTESVTPRPVLEQTLPQEHYDNSRGQHGYVAVTGMVYWARGEQFLVRSHYGGMKVTLDCERPSGPLPGPYSTVEQVVQELRVGRTVEVAVPLHSIAMLGYDQQIDGVCPGALRFDVEYTPLLPGEQDWRQQGLQSDDPGR